MTASAPWSPDKGQYPVAFIPLVGDDRTGLETGQQKYSLGNVRPLTPGERETNRAPLGISHQVNLGAQSATGAAQSLTLPPLCRRPPADEPAL